MAPFTVQAIPLLLAMYAPPPPWLPPPDTARSTYVETAPAADETPHHHDPLFGDGASVSLTTGVPFIGMGEVAWGFGDRFTLGALIGLTPNVLGVGARPRVVVVQSSSGRDRLQVVMPILYYPQTSDGSPWMLTRPMVGWSHGWDSGVRFGVGVGIIAATSVGKEAHTYAGTNVASSGVAWWNTVGVDCTVPVGRDVSLFGEATLVMKGARLAGPDWVGGPPFTLSLGVSFGLL